MKASYTNDLNRCREINGYDGNALLDHGRQEHGLEDEMIVHMHGLWYPSMIHESDTGVQTIALISDQLVITSYKSEMA